MAAEEGKSADVLPEHGVATMVSYALHAAAAGGIVSGTSAAAKHVPITLTPAKFPRKSYEHGFALMRPYGELVDRASRDVEWLRGVVAGAAAADDFSARMLKVFDTVQAEGVAQPLALGLLRSDYMLDTASQALLQVELNTISSSFGVLCSKLTKLHKHLLARFLDDEPWLRAFMAAQGDGGEADWSRIIGHARLPTTDAIAGLAAGIAAAHKANGNGGDRASQVLFVVQPSESNFVDQRELEYELLNSHGVRCVRRTLGELATAATLSADKRLVVDGRDISVVYYRAGYTPTDYKTEAAWDVRLLIERSKAVKCPNIAYHLVGMKKVQQALAVPGAVERFLSPADAKLVRTSFAGLWNLDVKESNDDGAAVREIVARACADPERYVLKPQREGGGNNYYGADVKAQLEALSDDERAAFVLMQRIFPAEQQVVFMRDGASVQGAGINEFGVYGIVLGDGKTLLQNRAVGHLIRTKLVGVDEGGVASGYACVSSPYLV